MAAKSVWMTFVYLKKTEEAVGMIKALSVEFLNLIDLYVCTYGK